jgi:hypothetical protein
MPTRNVLSLPPGSTKCNIISDMSYITFEVLHGGDYEECRLL